MQQKQALTIGILAGGKSSRMGSDKAKLLYEGIPFVKKIADELSGFDQIILSTAYESKNDEIRLPRVKTVSDSIPDCGPIEGIRQVLKASRNDFVFFCATDMPLLSKKLPEYISSFISSDYNCYVLTYSERPQPLCAIYSKKLLPIIEENIKKKDFKLSHIFDSARTKYIPIELSALNAETIININTKEEYQKLGKPLIFCVSGLKNSGKTRMVLLLISEFKERGFSVGVIKHDGHDCFSDLPGSDTANFTARGADCTAIFSDRRYAFNANQSVNEQYLIEKMCSLTSPPDIIILEGFKNSDYPKIEVMRKSISTKSVCKKESILCTAADFTEAPYADLPHFSADQAGKIADYIIQNLKTCDKIS